VNAISPCHTNATDSDYMQLRVYLTSLLCDQSGDCVQTEEFLSCYLLKENVLRTLSVWKSLVALSDINMAGSVIVLQGVLKLYLLLYTDYCWKCFHFQINIADHITVTMWTWNVAMYADEPKKKYISLPEAL
jgi:hypothetical protein